MSGLLSANLTEAQGSPASPAEIDRTLVTIGYSSAGTGLSAFFSSASAAVTAVGYGDAVDCMCQAIEQRLDGAQGIKYAGAMCSTPGSTPGSYGTIDVTGVTGTAIVTVDAATLPYATARPWIKVITGFTVGTAGGAIQYSADDGINWSNTISIGTADSYLIASLNAKFLFNPSATDVTAVYTLINEEFTDHNAHVILVTGVVHTNADTADQVSAGTFPSATTPATAVARINALIAAAKLHAAKGTAGTPATHINLAGDTTYLAALTAIPAATDIETALAAALLFKAAHNAHLAGTTWHTIADVTNTTTSPAPLAGTLIAGDIVKVRTFAPAPSAADIDAAFVTLSTSSINMGLIALEFPLTAALAAHVTTGLNLLVSTRGKRPSVIARTRLPNFESSETEAAWMAAVSADFINFNDSRIHIRSTYGLITDATTSRQYLRSDLATFVAETVRVERFEWPGSPDRGALPGFSLVDANSALVGHDEGGGGVVTGLSNETLGNRFGCDQRMPVSQGAELVYSTVPWTLFGPTNQIKNLPTRRVCNAIERAVITIGTSRLGGVFAYNKTTPPTLTPVSLRAIHSLLFQYLSAAFQNDIDNANAGSMTTGLVRVDPTVTVTGGNLLGVTVAVAPSVFGYLLTLNITLQVQE